MYYRQMEEVHPPLTTLIPEQAVTPNDEIRVSAKRRAVCGEDAFPAPPLRPCACPGGAGGSQGDAGGLAWSSCKQRVLRTGGRSSGCPAIFS